LRALRTWCELCDGRLGAILSTLRKQRKDYVSAKKAASGTGDAPAAEPAADAAAAAGTATRQAIEAQSKRAVDARRIVRSLRTLASALLQEPAVLLKLGG